MFPLNRCRHRQRTFLAGIFSPLELFSQGEQGAWYDPSDLPTLYQDAAGTIPVTADGQPVGLMLDKSGNGNHATQSVAARRPVYRTDGTLHWLEVDGVDDHFEQAVPTYRDSVMATDVFFGVDLDNDAIALMGYRNTPSYAFFSQSGSALTIVTAEYSFDAFRYNGAEDAAPTRGKDYDAIVNGGVVGITGLLLNSLPADPQILLAGRAAASIAYRFGGRFYGMVEVVGGVTDKEPLESYLANKSGVTL